MFFRWRHGPAWQFSVHRSQWRQRQLKLTWSLFTVIKMFIPLLAKSIYCSLYKPWSFENLFIWFIHILFQTFRIIIKFGPAPGHYNWAVSSLGLSFGIYKGFHSFISFLFQLFMLWLLRLGWQYIVSLSMLHQEHKYSSNIILVSFPSSFTQHSQPSMPRGTLQHCAMCNVLPSLQCRIWDIYFEEDHGLVGFQFVWCVDRTP